MGITFTRKGYIQVLKDGVVLSEHVEERKAVQSLSEREDGDYVLRYPDVAVTVILRKSDTTPPAVPSDFSASAATATSVTLTLTANVESDFSNYVLERSSDNIGWGYLKSFTGTSTTDTVDVYGSTYYYRAFSIDTRGNRSAYTGVKSAGPYTTSLSWNGTIPSITFTRGNAQNFDLSPYIIGEPGSISIQTGTLPPGVTLNSAQRRLEYDSTSASSSAIVQTGISLKLNTSAESDWQSRISGSSVVWYHDFESSNEVTNFRWGTTIGSGNDPNGGATKSAYVRRIATDGIRGSCMEIIRPANNGDDAIHWIRPMAPMFSGTTTGNGRTSDDPAANNSLTKRVWTPTQGGNQTTNFGYGWYQHPNYQTVDSDGHDFYVQLRVKMDPRRITGGNDAFGVGKFIWFTLCQTSLTTQEHVVWSYGYGGNDTGTKNYFRVYVHSVVGNAAFAPLDTGQSRIQPGNQSATDFSYSGGWDCLLIRIRPGVEGTTTGTNATQLQVWAATEAEIRAGQGYTASTKKIYDFTYGLSDYFGTSPSEYGFQALMLSGYNNGASFPQEFYHRYCQVIFSKAFIACPTY